MAWDCVEKTISIGGLLFNRRMDGTKEYGILVDLRDISPAGSHKARLEVHFERDWNKDWTSLILAPGAYESYTDPGGVEWQIHVDGTIYREGSSTAKIRICYEEAAPAEGQITSIDIPAEAAEGGDLDLCATIKNVGGTGAMFFLRFYDGATMVRETSPGNLSSGQTIIDLCEYFTMPGHKWTGRIELIRQG